MSGLSHFFEDDIPLGSEADALGAVTMLIQHYLTGLSTHPGDVEGIPAELVEPCTLFGGSSRRTLIRERIKP